jgi:hypothetical protein
MALHADWKEFLSLLNSNRVRFVVVGAHALAAHGHPRFTGDLDVLVESNAGNAARVLRALAAFGFGKVGLDAEDFARPGKVVRLGQPPVGIGILTKISGVSFASAWKHRVPAVQGGVRVHVLGRSEYLRNKRAAGRRKNRLDASLLQAAPRPRRRRTRRSVNSGSPPPGGRRT